MQKRWIAILLIAVMALSMLSGCGKKVEEEESAAADRYYENEASQEENSAEQEEEEEEPSGQSGSSSQSGSDQSDKGNNKGEQSQGGSNSSQGSSSNKKPSDNKNEGGSQNSSQKEDDSQNEQEGSKGDLEQEPEVEGIQLDYGWIDQDDESLYKDTPTSKTLTKTADGYSYYKENKIKVVSYNVRCADDADGHSVNEREWRLDSVLNKYDPDVMGFQEVTENWEGRLHLMLADEYDYVMVYRSEDRGKEANPIFYKPSKFKLLDAGYFWLSETPDQMGKGWDADHYRIATWVKLQVRATGDTFFYLNTHVDYKAGPQVPSAELLISKMKEISGGKGGIVTGDFNLNHSAAAYTKMCTYFADSNMATVKNTTQGTFPSYGKNKNGGDIIDYCFFTPTTLKAISYKVMTDMVDGKYVSDHFGVCSEIVILKK